MPFKYTEEEYEKDKKKGTELKDDLYVGDFERIKGMIQEQKRKNIQKL